MSWDMWTPKTRLFRNSLPFREDYSRGLHGQRRLIASCPYARNAVLSCMFTAY